MFLSTSSFPIVALNVLCIYPVNVFLIYTHKENMTVIVCTGLAILKFSIFISRLGVPKLANQFKDFMIRCYHTMAKGEEIIPKLICVCIVLLTTTILGLTSLTGLAFFTGP